MDDSSDPLFKSYDLLFVRSHQAGDTNSVTMLVAHRALNAYQ